MFGLSCVNLVLLNVLLILVQDSMQVPQKPSQELKSNVIQDMAPPITLDLIKTQLKESGVFDWKHGELDESLRKELKKLSDTLELYVLSRNRQPSNVQSTFANLELVKTVVKEQLAKGAISKTLADKFQWNQVSTLMKSRNAL